MKKLVFHLALIGLFLLVYSLREVSIQESLINLATNKVFDLTTTGTWSHTNSDGCDFSCRVDRVLNKHIFTGENLYEGPCDIRQAVESWQESPTHRKVLNSGYKNGVILITPKRFTDRCYIVMDISK